MVCMDAVTQERIEGFKVALNKALSAIEVDCSGVDCEVCPIRVRKDDVCLHDVISAMVEI